MKVAETYFANLTTYESLEANNSYAATNIPVGASLTVPVTCSCGGSSVSTEYGLFITYPLRPGDTLVSLAAETGLSTTLLQSYNPGVYFSQGSGLVYIPGKGDKFRYDLILSFWFYFIFIFFNYLLFFNNRFGRPKTMHNEIFVLRNTI